MSRPARFGLSLAAILVAFAAAPIDEVQVGTVSEPRPFREASGQVDRKIEASAVEPIGDGRLLLVADDKAPGLVVVDAETGKRVGSPLVAKAFPPHPKWEAMARGDDGSYYVCGSHFGFPAEIAERSSVVRFRLSAGDVPAIDESSVVRFDLTASLRRQGLTTDPPVPGGATIEGLAVQALPGGAVRLLFGLREPVEALAGCLIYAADLPPDPVPGGKVTPLELRRLFTFKAGRRDGVVSRISSLEYVPSWKGFLALTSSEDAANHFHGNGLWFLPEGDALPRRVWLFGEGRKAEGLCVLPGDAPDTPGSLPRLRLVITYDNDVARTGIASDFQAVTLLRWPE